MTFRSVNPGLYRIVQYHPALMTLLRARAAFRRHADAIDRVRGSIAAREEEMRTSLQRERRMADDVAGALLDDDTPLDAPPGSGEGWLPDAADFDTRGLELTIRLLKRVEEQLSAGMEAVIQNSLDDVFDFLDRQVNNAVDQARGGTADSRLVADYAEFRAIQRTLLRQIGFGLGDWRSAAIIQNVDEFWPQWRRYRPAGTAARSVTTQDSLTPPWPYEDLDAQLRWLVEHPAAVPWVPTPTELENLLESAVDTEPAH